MRVKWCRSDGCVSGSSDRCGCEGVRVKWCRHEGDESGRTCVCVSEAC